MPLPQSATSAYHPEFEHLLDEIARTDTVRRDPESAQRLNSGEGRFNAEVLAELSIDERAEQALQVAADYLTWKVGELLGMDKEHRQYLQIQDLGLDEIQQILLTDVPEKFRDDCLKLIERIRHRQVMHVLSASPILKQYRGDPGVDAPLDNAFHQVANASSPIIRSNNGYSWRQLNNFNHTPRTKTRIFPGEEGLPHPKVRKGHHSDNMITPPHSLIFMEGCELRSAGYKWHRPGLYQDLEQNLAYKTKLDFTNKTLKDSRLIAVTGQFNTARVVSSCIVPGANFSMQGGEWFDGELALETSEGVNLSTQFFFRTKITLPSSTSLMGTIFHGCDFSLAEIDDEDLETLADVCDERCVFSNDQKQKMRKFGETFSTQDEMIARLTQFAPNDSGGLRECAAPLGIGRVPVLMQNDHDDDDRPDLAGLPVLETAGMPQPREGSIDRRSFAPLTTADFDQLQPRIEFFQRLATFVNELGEYNAYAMVRFITEEGGPEMQATLNFGAPITNLPPHILDIPANKFQDRGRYWRHEYISREGKTVDGGFPKNPSYYAYVQWMRNQLKDLSERLYNYGLYLNKLTSEHSCHSPEIGPGSDQYQLHDLYHSNLPAELAEQGGELTQNDIDLLVGKGSRLLVLSGANKKAGKSTLLGAIATAIPQAQSGAPTPGYVSLPDGKLMDHVFIMPNLRSQMGGKESNMEGRARVVLEDFLGKIRALATEGTPEDPVRVFIGLDEIMMGVTDPNDAAVIENNFLETLMTIEGLEAHIVLVSPDLRVIKSMQNRFPDQIEVRAPESDENSYRLVPSAEAQPSSPAAVLAEKGLASFLERKSWMEA